jgi:hypothetical protein
MKNHILNLPIFVMLIPFTTFAQIKHISLHHENPHYFSYQEKPTVWISSEEHYGAVINPITGKLENKEKSVIQEAK